jgi:protein-S-isoprenylcysteine O-methyltransferase Ste14
MRPIAILQGFLYISLTFIAGPYLFIRLNDALGLPILDRYYLKYIAIVIAVSAFLAFLYCVGLFWFTGKGTPALVEPPNRLVVKGLYKYTRNPIYISHSLILLSYSLFFGHLMLFCYLILAISSYHIMVVYYEEPRLKKQFGEDYSGYLKKVPRWLSRFKPKK